MEAVSGKKKKSDYTISGDYSVWKDIVEGEQDPIQAIMVKDLILEGNLQIILKYIKAVDLLMELVQRIPSKF